MKKYIILAFVFSFFNTKAQITLIHTYDSASTIPNGSPALQDQLMLIKFETSGEKYVKINRHGKKILIYDLNHSLLKTIDFSGFPQSTLGGNFNFILYLSEKLFNTDVQIEFMYLSQNGGVSFTGIYNEEGSLLFSDTGAAAIIPNFIQQQYPIYNTTQGTIMILSYRNGQAKVFSLPGTLSASIEQANMQLMQQSGQFGNLYPNPGTGPVTIEYELPKGEAEGEIVLYNMAGLEVKRYGVDNTFKDIYLDNSMLPAGTYLWQLQTAKGAVGSKKMVVVK